MTDPPDKRRRFRFRLRTLLLLPVLFAVGWWWIIWPGRTLRKLDALVAAGQEEEAAAMIEFEPNYRYPPEKVAHQLRQAHTEPTSRSLFNLVLGRQPFEIDKGGVACFVYTGTRFLDGGPARQTAEDAHALIAQVISMLDTPQTAGQQQVGVPNK